ncbi:transporter [Gracilibacillus boraciitolerans JCM 21714]|uniref:Transporter n=1 Tax=Gracilibacillus boraciitolerans JCM 21714 TaxID=1298598 RepID=W4VI13_9BACI|nr:CAP domain-containing protein [Gracilibacillus boraciitolerans]GAE92433.1 transporter [Gracilibacillus boraciitolerans JCM 21714]
MTLKKGFIFSLFLFLSLLYSSTVSAQEDIKVILDNEQIQFTDVKPIIKEGRTLIPVRKVFTEAGASVIWQENIRTVRIHLGENTIVMSIGNTHVQKQVNNIIKYYPTDVPSQIINNRTYIPLRVTCELLGYTVGWDYANRTVSLSSEAGLQIPDHSQIADFELKVLTLVNEERSKKGISELKLDTALSDVAREKSKDMLLNGYFSHTSPTYGSPFDMMQHFNILYRSAGENIAAGQTTPSSVMTAWMNSEGHRKNILRESYTHIGIGFAEGEQGYKYYWTQMFISK